MMEHHFKLQRGGKTHLNINQTASGGLSGVYRSDRVPRPERLCQRTFSVPPQRDRCDEARCTSGFGWSTNRSAQQSMGNSSPLNAEERLLYFSDIYLKGALLTPPLQPLHLLLLASTWRKFHSCAERKQNQGMWDDALGAEDGGHSRKGATGNTVSPWGVAALVWYQAFRLWANFHL